MRLALLLIAALLAVSPAAFAADPPYLPSQVITKLTWDTDAIKVADGSGDNWPITEDADGTIYTSYGDGFGFSKREPKLTIGFAKILGSLPNLRGEDIVSNIDAPMGGGPSGIKSSGLIAVEGVMYLFVRNITINRDFTNARLAWSRDKMKTWTWAGWHFSDTFGCPEFVQFGPNYSGARDNYVYVVSQDNDNPYDYSPNIVLARVPKDEIANRARWEFYAGPGRVGKPAWSADIQERKPIFTDPAGTQRIAMTFNRGLKRYILTTSHKPDPNARETIHTGALGVFEAPEPWGPWRTVYYGDYWSGTDRTYHHKFPTTWMSEDGKTMWLLYSGLGAGNYAFCLKRATLEVASPASRPAKRSKGPS